MKTIYYGDIITMEPLKAEAILVENEIIKKVGTKKEVMKLKDKDTKVVNLKNNCLMPAFIDAHSHIMAVAKTFLIADLKEAKTKEDAIKILENFKTKKGKWILGYNYNLNENPVKDNFPDNPVLVTHVSGHTGYLNSKAMNLLKKESNGYFEEQEFMEIVNNIKPFTLNDLIKGYKKAEKLYLSYGITTAQEGLLTKENFDVLKALALKNNLILEVTGYTDSFKITEKNSKYNNFKVGGYKIFLDGSPSAKTAFLLEPYIGTNNYGISNYSHKELEEIITKVLKEKKQLLIHSNGDAASLQLVNVYQTLSKKYQEFYRPVLIHAQIIDKKELEKAKDLKIIPSFFVSHVYHFGDVHIKNLGFSRASNISPLKWASDLNLIYTIHQDSPVLKPHILEGVWCAVNRLTKNNVLLGENQKIEVYEALKAVTINAAYQYFAENKKGSIKEGKEADLIILDKNPLKIAKKDIINIKVIETIKKGISVYKI